MSILEQLLSTIAPHACVGCRVEGTLLCATCLKGMPLTPVRCYRCPRPTQASQVCSACRPFSPLKQVWSVTPYLGLAKKLLHTLKFERACAAAQPIGRAIAAQLPREEFILTHIPTATTRVRARGYDQAHLIAQAVAKESGRPYIPLLARTSQQRQLGRGRIERQQQLRQAFRALPGVRVLSKPVVLIDDVLTTGSTLEAAANILQATGVRHISAAVFAVA